MFIFLTSFLSFSKLYLNADLVRQCATQRPNSVSYGGLGKTVQERKQRDRKGGLYVIFFSFRALAVLREVCSLNTL